MTSVFMHHNEKIFPDSYRFNPERWMDPAERKRLETYLVAFSKGSRQCIGLKYVLTFLRFSIEMNAGCRPALRGPRCSAPLPNSFATYIFSYMRRREKTLLSHMSSS